MKKILLLSMILFIFVIGVSCASAAHVDYSDDNIFGPNCPNHNDFPIIHDDSPFPGLDIKTPGFPSGWGNGGNNVLM